MKKENFELIGDLTALSTGENASRRTEDMFGNCIYWFRLDMPEYLPQAAERLHKAHARLATTTAYSRVQLVEPVHEICYHFELEGTVYNVTVLLDEEHPSVPSITSIFRNADWNEREMMELYAINIANHPNPRRLFLDEQIDVGVMGQAVPLSIMMNGACTVDLWERILKDRAQAEAAAQGAQS